MLSIYPREIPQGDLIACDTETTGLQYQAGDSAFAFSFCNVDGDIGYFDWPVDPMTRKVTPNLKELKTIRRWAADPAVSKVFHNAPFDMGNTEWAYDFKWNGDIHDTTCSVHCWDSARYTYELKPMARDLCLIPTVDEKELQRLVVKCRHIGKQRGWSLHEHVEADYWMPKAVYRDASLRSKIDGFDVTMVDKYAGMDAYRCMQLFLLSLEKFADDELCIDAYEFEMRQLFPIIRKMCKSGLRVHHRVISKEIEACRNQEGRAMGELIKYNGGKEFDPNKPHEVRELLFRKNGIEALRFTEKTEVESTDKDSLSIYMKEPVVRELFTYRTAYKGRTSFFEAFDRYKVNDPDDESQWLVFANINQFGKRTARLSCTSPNLQALANPDASANASALPSQSKKPFGPRDGYVWWLLDYSQLEVRIFALCSQYDKLLSALESGQDMHGFTAEQCWGNQCSDKNRQYQAFAETLELDGFERGRTASTQELASVWRSFPEKRNFDLVQWFMQRCDYSIVDGEKAVGKKNWRYRGKRIFFNRMFGGGYRPVMEKLFCTEEEAREYIKAYDGGMPGIIEYVYVVARDARHNGYVLTKYGRKLRVPKNEDYKGASYEVQGTAADVIKRAMINIDRYIELKKLPARLLLQIHDELIIEVREDHATPKLARRFKSIMEDQGDVVGMYLPVNCEVAVKYWSETEKLKL